MLSRNLFQNVISKEKWSKLSIKRYFFHVLCRTFKSIHNLASSIHFPYFVPTQFFNHTHPFFPPNIHLSSFHSFLSSFLLPRISATTSFQWNFPEAPREKELFLAPTLSSVHSSVIANLLCPKSPTRITKSHNSFPLWYVFAIWDK